MNPEKSGIAKHWREEREAEIRALRIGAAPTAVKPDLRSGPCMHSSRSMMRIPAY